MTKSTVIKNLRVIAGIFREAILTQTEIRMANSFIARVYSVEEQDRRAIGELRTLVMSTEYRSVETDKEYEFEISASGAIVSGWFKCLYVNGDFFTVKMPDNLTISDLRSEIRIEPRMEKIPPTTILFATQGVHYEAAFRLINISRSGIAGIVDVDRDFTIPVGARVTGRINSSDGLIDLVGVVVATALHDKKGDRQKIFVRISKIPKQHESETRIDEFPRDNSLEKRSAPRFHSHFNLEMTSLLAINHTIIFEITNVSITGFFAKCHSPQMTSYLLPGTPLKLLSSSMIAEILEIQGENIRCKWASGNDNDRLIWLKKISPFISHKVTLSTPEASKILSIFCRSGAFSSEFIRSQREGVTEVTSTIESENGESSYIHRWIDTAKSGLPAGHISCIRMGDNAWFATDLAKPAQEDLFLSDGFVEKFLKSFSLFAETLCPVPRILLIWVKEHPYWKNFDLKLFDFEDPDIFRVSIGYTRISNDKKSLGDSIETSVCEIFPNQFDVISKITTKLGLGSVLQMAKIFDFDIDRFGSPHLREKIRSDGKTFWRRYFEVKLDNFSGLLILTGLPEGMNPNRVIDSAWLFQYANSENPVLAQWENIITKIRIIAALGGQAIVGIRRVSSCGTFKALPSEHAEMKACLVHPKLLRLFSN